MPKVPNGPLRGAMAYRVVVTRKPDDTVVLPNDERMGVLRASIGGSADIGFYLQFRGEPEKVVEMLEVVSEAAKQMLPAGNYTDER